MMQGMSSSEADAEDPRSVNARLLAESLQRNVPRWAADPQLIAARPETVVASAGHSSSLRAYLAALFKHFGARACLATRAAAEDAPYKSVSYSQVWSRVQRVAHGMRAAGVAAPGSHVGLYGFPSAEWVVSYVACIVLGATAVPLQTNMNEQDLAYVVQHGDLTAVFAKTALLPQLLPVLNQAPSVHTVVTIDDDDEHAAWEKLGATHSNLRFIPLDELEKMPEVATQSESESFESKPFESESSESELALILFTSGSTGRPKGAMFPSTLWRVIVTHPRPAEWSSVPVVTTVFNLNHISGLYNLHGALNVGGTVHFLRRHDMSTFFEDVRAIRPTFMFLVPRLMELVHEQFEVECMRRRAAQSSSSMAHADDTALRDGVMADMRSTFLGDRLVMVMFGSAVTLPETVAFMQQCFKIPAYNLYGATESMYIAHDGHINRDVVEEFKLVDTPALGYTRADKPHPRGELYIKSRWLIPGYYRNEAATASLRDADGFLATGDIVEQRGPERVAYVDRARNVLKLAQGEFVATAKLETIYTSNGTFVAQMFVYGRSEHAYLLAVVVPHMDAVRAKLGGATTEPSPESVRSLLLAEMQHTAETAHLAGWEMPRAILVEMEPFTKANGLLTDSDKLSRPHLLAKYQSRLMQMFSNIEQLAHRASAAAAAAAAASTSSSSSFNAGDLVTNAIAAVLGCDLRADDEQTRQLSFVHMGGDSLSASRLVQMLKQATGTAPPVALVLDGNTSIAALIQFMDQCERRRRWSWQLTFNEVHGKAPSVVRAADLALARFFDEATVREARELPLRPRPAHVLLTGANGFLGRFLLLELLQQCDLCVTAIVRAPDDATAMDRLRASYGRRLAPLLDGRRLRVLAGDLMRPSFGLSDEVYDDLCSRVDTVLHNGALVNHSFSYEDLWEPNVLGTVEVMRFAMRRQRKSTTFMSTVAVAAGTREVVVSESHTGAQLWPERRVTSDYAAGYADSKWACEVLLEQLAEQASLPVAVVRSSMVLPHPDDAHFPGQVNKTDFLTRLFASVVHTSVRPRSFYVEGRPSSSPPHFDGVPVDVSASGIVAVALSTREPGLHGFHATNAHYEDGVSLDSFMDWIDSADYPLHVVRPYGRWFDDFSRRLAELEPHEVRDATAYPILFQWTRPIDPSTECRLDNRRFCAILREHTKYAHGVPVLDEHFLHTYLSQMQVAGLLPPSKVTATRTSSSTVPS